MATTSPARIDDDLYASAKLAGEVQSRSASQQVVHWARIGRELEASASVSARAIAEVLAGSRSYDALDPKEQAMVRAEWAARMDARREALDFTKSFVAAGRVWVELDDEGNVVERGRRRGQRAVAAKKAASIGKRAKSDTARTVARSQDSKATARGTRARKTR
jgi:hypothetical protein